MKTSGEARGYFQVNKWENNIIESWVQLYLQVLIEVS